MLKCKGIKTKLISIMVKMFFFVSIANGCTSLNVPYKYEGKYKNDNNGDIRYLELFNDSTCCFKYKFQNITKQNFGIWHNKGDYIVTVFVETDNINKISMGIPVDGILVFKKDKNKLHYIKEKSEWGSIENFTIKRIRADAR